MGGSSDDDVGAEVDETAEETNLVTSGRAGIVAGRIFAGIDIAITFEELDIDDDKVSTFLRGGDVGLGFLVGVKIGAGGIVVGVTAGGIVVGEHSNIRSLVGDFERDGGFCGSFSATDSFDAETTVKINGSNGVLVAAILVVVAGEFDDVEAGARDDVDHVWF